MCVFAMLNSLMWNGENKAANVSMSVDHIELQKTVFVCFCILPINSQMVLTPSLSVTPSGTSVAGRDRPSAHIQSQHVSLCLQQPSSAEHHLQHQHHQQHHQQQQAAADRGGFLEHSWRADDAYQQHPGSQPVSNSDAWSRSVVAVCRLLADGGGC